MRYIMYFVKWDLLNKPVGVEKPTKCHYFFLPWRTEEKKNRRATSDGVEEHSARFYGFSLGPTRTCALLLPLIRHTTTQYHIKTVQRAHMLAGQRYSQDDTLYAYNAHTQPLYARCSNTCTSGERHRRPYFMLLYMIIYYEKNIAQ